MLKFHERYNSHEVSRMLNVSDSTVRDWLNRYNEKGLSGLIPQHRGGSDSKLSDEQLRMVKEVLQQSPREKGYNKSNWTIPLLKLWIGREFGVKYSIAGLNEPVHRLGFSIQRPKKQCKATDPEKQEQFKKELKKILEGIDDDTVILYLDEALITDDPTTTGKWALKGDQPVIPANSKGSRKRRVIYGAANPKTGEVFYSTKRTGNTENFEPFLE